MKYADAKLKYDEEYSPKHHYSFHGECLRGNHHEVKVPANELFKYRQGDYIQDALKSVSASDREFLLTGGCCI